MKLAEYTSCGKECGILTGYINKKNFTIKVYIFRTHSKDNSCQRVDHGDPAEQVGMVISDKGNKSIGSINRTNMVIRKIYLS